MPNAKVLSEKQAIVAALTEKLQNASAGVLVDYKGITVAEDTALRAELRKNNVEYAVVKNTLLRFAAKNCGLDELDGVLNGTTSLAICNDDPVAPARVINDFAKKLNGKFEIKGGFMDGKVMSLNEVMALAELPSKDVLQAQALGMMLAPITSFAIVIKAICEQKGGSVEEAPAEEAPAAHPACSGSGYHAGPHFRSGLRAEADRREAGRSCRGGCRGSRCRVIITRQQANNAA